MGETVDTKPAPKGAKTKAAANKSPLLTTMIKLITPIYNGDDEITTVSLTEPLFHQAASAEAEAKAKKTTFFEILMRLISDLPQASVAHLKLRDAAQIKRWLKQNNVDAVRAAGLEPVEPDADEAGAGNDTLDPFDMGGDETQAPANDELILDGERVIKLLVPVSYEGRTITAVTCREPSLAAAMRSGKQKTERAVTAALIAAVTGEELPVIGRMSVRDTQVIEAWLAPFVQDLLMEDG